MEVVGERLRSAGWTATIDRSSLPDAPTWVITAQRGEESLMSVARLSARDRLVLPDQYSIGAVGMVAPASSQPLNHLFARLPFTNLEFSEIAVSMPLTASLPTRLGSWIPELDPIQTKPFAGFGAIFTIHHQTDFLLLLQLALDLGIDPKLATVIDKEYPYLLSSRVDATIRTRFNIPVFRFTDILKGIKDHIERILVDRDVRAAASWTPTIVIDDGGYILPRLQEFFEPQLSLFRGVVEQTTSGIWALHRFERIRVPIFSVAESDLKKTVEAHGVAMAAVTNLRRLFPNEKFDGRRALVAGYGKIGEALANILRRFRMQVSIADNEYGTAVAAKDAGIHAFDSITKALESEHPRFIFSCAAPGAFGEEQFRCIKSDCFLVSLTSRDVAFDKEALSVVGRGEPYGTVGTIYTTNSSDPVRLFLVADGYPINFHYAESMPNQQSDLVMASLLVGAIHLCTASPSWPAGNDPARANFHLNNGTLLKDYFHDGII